MDKQLSRSRMVSRLKRYLPLYIMLVPVILYYLIFMYAPMGGLIIAFKDYNVFDGIWDSPWVGLRYFEQFFTSMFAPRLIRNTLMISLYNLIFGFTSPIILALMFNEVGNMTFKKASQTISYLPYFISWAVFSGITIKLLDPTTGALGQLLVSAGMIDEGYYILNHPENIYAVVIISGLIKGLGWGSIVYVASLTSVSEELVESALLEGANRLQKMYYISFPTIKGTVAIYLIFAVSGVLGSNFDQMYLLKNGMNESKTEVIDTFVYEIGIKSMNISYSTAVGLMRSVLAFILLVGANFASKKMSGHGIY